MPYVGKARAGSVGGTSRPSGLAVMRQDARIRELEEELERARACSKAALRRAGSRGAEGKMQTDLTVMRRAAENTAPPYRPVQPQLGVGRCCRPVVVPWHQRASSLGLPWRPSGEHKKSPLTLSILDQIQTAEISGRFGGRTRPTLIQRNQ
jgi:hypothetical protein